MRHRTRRRLLRIVIALLIPVIATEIGLRLLIPPQASASPTSHDYLQAYRLSNPPQYAGSPYYSKSFVYALNTIYDYRYLNQDMQYAFHDFAVPGYTVTDNIRLTTNQPSHWSHTVWLFGSSTMWGPYVADGWTIASYLQRLLPTVRVVNAGKISTDITIANYWLKRSDIRPGDIVIYMDGGVDFKDMLNLAYKLREDETPACQLSKVVALLTFRMACASATMSAPSSDYIARAIPVEFPRYARNVAQARAYTKSHGAAFYHFMQPIPPPQFAFPYVELYPQLFNGDPLLSVNSADFFDDFHYDDTGNATVASAIYAAIWRTF